MPMRIDFRIEIIGTNQQFHYIKGIVTTQVKMVLRLLIFIQSKSIFLLINNRKVIKMTYFCPNWSSY